MVGQTSPTRRQALGLGVALSLGVTTKARAQSGPIKIGIATDLSGVAAAFANSQVNGLKFAVDELNRAGGVLGRQIEVIVRDSQAKPDLGVSHARDLITGDKVDLLVGPVSSGVALGISNLARQHSVPIIMTIPNTPRLAMELFHPYFFTVTPSGLMEARAMAEAIGKKHQTFGFIGGDYEAGRQALAYFRAHLAKVNPEARIIVEAFPKLGEPDHTSYITRLMSARPQAVFSYLWGADIVGFVKQARPYRFFERISFASLFFFDDLRALGAEMPDGVTGQMRAPFFAIDTPAMKEFTRKFSEKYNEHPADWAIMTYEAIQLFAEGAKKAGSVRGEELVKGLEGASITGLRGELKFRKEDHQANSPSYIGNSVTDPSFPFKIFRPMEVIQAEAVWPSLEEVAASRRT
ncbi:ABC transporter substrate-binding protein [Micromonospora sp. STR1s_5]|nr:ABC transporter substrate-binding protein [Micromonospora sp. STR1s_5]